MLAFFLALTLLCLLRPDLYQQYVLRTAQGEPPSKAGGIAALFVLLFIIISILCGRCSSIPVIAHYLSLRYGVVLAVIDSYRRFAPNLA